MKRYWFIIIFLILPLCLPAEGFIGGGSFVSLSSTSDPQWTPGAYMTGGGDLFLPFGSAWSFFSEGGGRFEFYPVSGDLGGSAYASTDVSYRGELFYTRAEAGSFIEYYSWTINPAWDSYGEVYLSLDFPGVSVFTDPSYICEFEDGMWATGGEGSVGLSAGLGSVVLSPAITGGIKTSTAAAGYDSAWGSELGISWYPGIPLTADCILGFSRIDSPYREILIAGGDPLAVESGTVLYMESEISCSLGRRLDLAVKFDGSFTLKDYGYILEDGSQGNVREYRLYGEPEATVTFGIAPGTDVRFSLGGEFLYSNSSYLDTASGTAELAVFFSF